MDTIQTSEPRLFSLVVPPGPSSVEYITTTIPDMIKEEIKNNPDKTNFWNTIMSYLPTTISETGLKFHMGLDDNGNWHHQVSFTNIPYDSLAIVDTKFHCIA